MKTNEKQVLYWIKGNDARGNEVIDALVQKGGANHYSKKGNNYTMIYYINEDGYICDSVATFNCAKMIMHYGVELTLPEKRKVLSWEDISKTDGYILMPDRVEKRHYDYKISTSFATEQQAKSAQAAAMISQIREQGKEVYGEIVNNYNDDAYVICYSNDGKELDIYYIYYCNGFLCFETKEQAQLFLDNNRELVKEYLKTF